MQTKHYEVIKTDNLYMVIDDSGVAVAGPYTTREVATKNMMTVSWGEKPENSDIPDPYFDWLVSISKKPNDSHA